LHSNLKPINNRSDPNSRKINGKEYGMGKIQSDLIHLRPIYNEGAPRVVTYANFVAGIQAEATGCAGAQDRCCGINGEECP
jgi:hypothetical protein